MTPSNLTLRDNATGSALAQGQTPGTIPDNTITSSTLAPVNSYKLPNYSTNTAAVGLGDYITSLNGKAQTEQNTLNTEKNDIGSLIQQLGNSGKIQDQLNQQNGVDQYKKQVDQYTNQIEAEQLANRRQVQELNKNAGGLYGGQVQAEVNRVTNDSIQKQADLAILQNAASRNYSTASAIADRQLQATLQPIQANLDALKFFYTENKADFNKEDDRIYNQLITEQTRGYEDKKANLTSGTDILKSAITNGAPANVIATLQTQLKQGATPDQLLVTAGSYLKAPQSIEDYNKTFASQGYSTPPQGGFRTDRNNNPTAMTVNAAKALGLVEGVDYVVGDKFPGSSNLYTARLIGDGIETTIKGLDNAASTGKGAFQYNGGKSRWSYITMTDAQWNAMTPEQKKATVISMYKREGGSGTLAGANSTANQPTKDVIDVVGGNLQSVAGKDGYISPEDYNSGLDQWMAAKHPAKDYYDNFKKFINPADAQDYKHY